VATPVIRLWDGIVAVPLIGTLDSAHSQVVMESLLDAIVTERARYAILDITGVPTVDSLVAQYLVKTVAAARLMDAECIVSGTRPAIAQTIVHLGIDLGTVVTWSSLAHALACALRRQGIVLRRAGREPAVPGPVPGRISSVPVLALGGETLLVTQQSRLHDGTASRRSQILSWQRSTQRLLRRRESAQADDGHDDRGPARAGPGTGGPTAAPGR
jgi:anti-anti-sigma regulatory factor